jgi:hypothetical protein
MFKLMIAKSKLSAQSDWDQIQAGAKALLSSSAVGAWTYRASGFRLTKESD